jgi:hypothetical protein
LHPIPHVVSRLCGGFYFLLKHYYIKFTQIPLFISIINKLIVFVVDIRDLVL